jgi:hypothetical protein
MASQTVRQIETALDACEAQLFHDANNADLWNLRAQLNAALVAALSL